LHVRYLAVDLGDRRTGVALGDAATRIVTPLEVVGVAKAERGGESLLEALARVAGDHLRPGAGGDTIVVGLPLNMDGTEGPASRAAREFGERLGRRTGLRVEYQDERLPSAEADWSMSRSGLTRRE
jgi:putative Holliday junction resolvase